MPAQEGNGLTLPQAEIKWERLDKNRFFLLGVSLFSGVSACLYPTTVIKTRLQVRERTASSRGAVLEVVRSVLRNDGVLGFWKGFPTVVVGTIPARIVYMGTLEFSKKLVEGATAGTDLPEATRAGLRDGVAGMSASLATQSVVVPIDVVSQRLMVQQGARDAAAAGSVGGGVREVRYRGGLDAFRHILKEQGVRGLYRGFGISVATYAPSSACWWASYGYVQRVFWRELRVAKLIDERPSEGVIMAVQAVSGACAGGVSAVLTTPLDTVKTRFQVLARSADGKPPPRLLTTVKDLLREEGVLGFYRGLGPRWFSMSLWGTAMISTYELLKRLSAKPEGAP